MHKPLDTSNVPVTVNVTVSPHGVATCTCSPSPAPVVDPDSTLTFTLNAPANWEFLATGAVVVGSPADQFPQPSSTAAGGLSATLFDVNSDKNTYSYTVYVYKTTTGERLRHDPAIKNGNNGLTDPSA